jgi:hypothetical protein
MDPVPRLYPKDDKDTVQQGTQQLMHLAMSHVISQSLYTSIRLGIPEILSAAGDTAATRAMTIDDIVTQLESKKFQANKKALLQLMRVCVSVGIFQEESTDNSVVTATTFRLTATGRLLVDNDGGVKSMFLHLLEGPLWNSWSKVPNYVSGELLVDQEQQLPFDAANDNTPAAEYYSNHLDSLQHANAFVKWISQQEIRASVDGFDWSIFNNKTVVDLGGHRGDVMQAVANKHPAVHCVCFDLPSVIEAASATATASIQYVAGDMFDASTVPTCNAIFMKHILLCDWDEENSKRILATCCDVLPEGGLVIIAEACLPDPGKVLTGDSSSIQHQLPILADALMMVVGRDSARTVSEWTFFAESCGFQVDSVMPTIVPSCSIIVLRKKC